VMPGYVNGVTTDAIGTGYQDRYGWNNQYDDGFNGNVSPGASLEGVTYPALGSAGNITADATDATASANITSYDVFAGTRPRNVALLPCIKY